MDDRFHFGDDVLKVVAAIEAETAVLRGMATEDPDCKAVAARLRSLSLELRALLDPMRR
jgi:hypothetical protein